MNFSSLFKYLPILMICLLFGQGCITKPKSDKTEDQYSYAKTFFDDEDYDLAIQKLSEFRSRYPYSKYSSQAALLIAESEFKQGRYEDAIVSYGQFVKLYPNHEKADYSQFMIGESYWKLAPKAVNREQNFTKEAIAAWEMLSDKYPSSKYLKETAEKISAGKKRLALSEEVVSKYYCRMKILESCVFRSLSLANKYPKQAAIRNPALLRASAALKKMAKSEDPKENYYNQSMLPSEMVVLAEKLAAEAQGVR